MKNPRNLVVPALLLLPAIGSAQVAISLGDAVERAQKNYPTVQVSQAQVAAAAASIRFARTSYHPRLDSLTQVNRATRNNVFGMLMPQSVIAPISGPPVDAANTSSVFGSAGGVLFEWEPFDFGLRRSRVDYAESTTRRAEASVVRTQFEAGAAAADSYLTVLAAQETVKAARANVERSEVLLQIVESLVRAELRPGADATAGLAELAAAHAQVIRGEQAVAEAKALLAGLVGDDPSQISVTEGGFLHLPDEIPVPEIHLAQNPLAREQDAAVQEARARAKTFDHLWAPRFLLQGTTSSRGTGASPGFITLGGARGLAPSFYNWGVGLTVMFPLVNTPIRAQQAGEAARIRVEEGRYRLILTELETRRNQALAAVEAARKLAELAPAQLEAAKAAGAQAQARYKAGLATLVEVADAQRVLAQAEIDNGIARLNVWRALLMLRSVEGDLAPFLQLTGR